MEGTEEKMVVAEVAETVAVMATVVAAMAAADAAAVAKVMVAAAMGQAGMVREMRARVGERAVARARVAIPAAELAATWAAARVAALAVGRSPRSRCRIHRYLGRKTAPHPGSSLRVR